MAKLEEILARKRAEKAERAPAPSADVEEICKLARDLGGGKLPPQDTVRSLQEKLADMLPSTSEFRKGSKAYERGLERGVQATYELRRILELPRRQYRLGDVDLTDKYRVDSDQYQNKNYCAGCELCRNSRGEKREVRLRPVQSMALYEAENLAGVFMNAAVGDGKTLASLLLLLALTAKRGVILVKPSLKNQLVNVYRPLYERHFRMPEKSTYTVLSYSDISQPSNTDIFQRLQPDVIVGDEVQEILKKSSARTKRFRRYFEENPGTKLAALTGTFMKRSILDLSWFLETILGHNSPLPKWPALGDWAAALDEPIDGAPGMNPGALLKFCTDEEMDQVERCELDPKTAARAGFRRRLADTPGVIVTDSADSVPASLTIVAVALDKDPAIEKALAHVRAFWEWDGEEFEDALQKSRVCRQLALGFFYRWVWPNKQRDDEWLEARRAWHREIRAFLQHRAYEGCDSPLLYTNAVKAGREASEAWSAWDKVRHRPKPPTEAVWLTHSVIDACTEWLSAGDNGIVFYWHTEFGEKLAWKHNVPHFGAGDSKKLDEAIEAGPSRFPRMVLSARAFGAGKNLQKWSRGLITSPPASGLEWEQVLGREHRPGQQADDVEYVVLAGQPEIEQTIKNAITNARFLEETSGARQKLLYADRLGFPTE